MPSRVDLSGADHRQVKLFIEALKNALDLDAFVMVVYFASGQEIDKSGVLDIVIYRAVRDAQRQGWINELFDEATKYVPKAPALLKFIATYETLSRDAPPAFSAADIEETGEIETDDRVALEKLLIPEPDTPPDILAFTNKLASLQRRVCLVEDNGSGFATGILVSSNLVLTVGYALQHRSPHIQDSCTVCFDYLADERRIMGAGRRLKLNGEPPLLIGYNDVGNDFDRGNVSIALLRLSEPIGSGALEDGTVRGWISLKAPSQPPKLRTPVFAIGHALAGELRLVSGDLQAVRARTLESQLDTAPGMGGGPVLDAHLNLLGLHFAAKTDIPGAPAGKLAIAWQSGIILETIKARSVELYSELQAAPPR